jgi:hypothetical protein
MDAVEELDVARVSEEAESAEADHLAASGLEHSPEPEAVPFERLDSALKNLTRFLAGDRFTVPEEPADVAVGPERVERVEVFRPPRPQRESGGDDLVGQRPPTTASSGRARAR